MNRNASMRRLLRRSPSTGHELAALLDIPLRSAQVGLWVLQHQGHIRKTGRGLESDAGGRARNLYELTERGEHFKVKP